MGGLGKLIGVRQCDNCGADIEIRHKKRMEQKNIFCCKSCEGEYRHKQSKPNVECFVCHKKIHRKPSHLTDVKHPVCSMECHSILNSLMYQNENNPNYGNRGLKNPLWKSDEKISYYGYRLIRCIDHPFANCDGFVFEHRLVAERCLIDDNNSVVINDKRYLDPNYVVHHIDFDRLNNNKTNLVVMTSREHFVLHHTLKNSEQELKKYCRLHFLDVEIVKHRLSTN